MRPLPVLVSRCLLGVPCRYHGRPTVFHARIRRMAESGRYLLVDVCPEVDGGLSVPRPPTRPTPEGRLVCGGRDVTAAFERGARLALGTARRAEATKAYLVRGSPSCDRWRGVAALLLQENGVRVVAV